MMTLMQEVTTIFADAFEACGFPRSYGQVVVSQRPDLGQFQCNGALPAAGQLKNKQKKKVNPRAIGQQVVDAIAKPEYFADLSLAGPGFINITLLDEYLTSYIQSLASDERCGVPLVSQPRKVIVDYGGANVAKPMHVGHLRTAIIGESIKRLLIFMGHDVLGDIHLGDWGTQMGMLIVEIKDRQPALPYFDGNYTGPYPEESPVTIDDLADLYPIVSSRALKDPETMEAARQATVELQQGRPGYRALWQHFVNVSHTALRKDYDNLGVYFELWYGESDVHDRIAPMLKRLQEEGYTQESEGALIMDVTEEGAIPPLILVKSDGGLLYGTTDLATIDQRVQELQAEEILYVVDARQSMHFQQVFRAAKKSAIAGQEVILEHLGFGTMNGKDGKPFKTRAGGVMRLSDLISMITEAASKRLDEAGAAQNASPEERAMIAKQVGLAALKYADLSNNRTSDYIFDLDRFTAFEGRTGPYLLYSAVRIKSILRKADEQGLISGHFVVPAHHSERELMIQLTHLPEVIEYTCESYSPNHLCEYAYHLALAFNRFYNTCHIMSEENAAQQGSWLGLCDLTLRQFELISYLLGLEIPAQM